MIVRVCEDYENIVEVLSKKRGIWAKAEKMSNIEINYWDVGAHYFCDSVYHMFAPMPMGEDFQYSYDYFLDFIFEILYSCNGFLTEV